MGKQDRLARVSADMTDEERELVAELAVMVKRMSKRSRRDVRFFAEAQRERTPAVLLLELGHGRAATAVIVGERLPPHLLEVVGTSPNGGS